ncbi:MAG TPA: retroviral-like aspartic protease family protein [Chloroflexota bacterium]|jgi:clan AA aspartic protease
MTVFSYPIEVGDPDGQRYESIEALVDTGASFSIIPEPILHELGVTPSDRVRLELGDGRMIEFDVGHTWVRIDGRRTPDTVCFGHPGMDAILGAHTLEGFLLAVDPAGRRLVPTHGFLL